MSTNKDRRRTFSSSSKVSANFTITLSRTASDPDSMVTVEGSGVDEFIGQFRRCLMKSTADNQATICYLDDSNSNYYEDGTAATLTGTEGDVMVYFPEFYYKGETTTSAHKLYISTSEISGYYHSPASLVGAYKAYNSSSKTYSYSGVTKTTSVSFANFYNYTRNRGKGFHMIDYMQHRTIAWMFYAKYKSTNSQAHCGTGYDAYSGIKNGVTNSLGMTDTTASTASSSTSNMLVNFLGIEGCWGYVREFIEGLHSNSSDYAVIAYDKPDLANDSSSNYEYDQTYSTLQSNFNLPTLRKLNTSSLNGWISDIWGEDYMDMTITKFDGSNSTYYSDYGNVYPDTTCVFQRSYYYAFTYGGVSCLYYSSSGGTSSYGGSRLAFDGTIVESSSVSEFKAITSWR